MGMTARKSPSSGAGKPAASSAARQHFAALAGTMIASVALCWGGCGRTDLHGPARSREPLTWTQVTPSAAFPPRQAMSVVSFKGRIWVIAGGDFSSGTFYNDVWSSADGSSWRLEKGENGGFSPRWGQSVVLFHDKLWLTGGGFYDNSGWHPQAEVWSSDDGVYWYRTESAAFQPRMYHGSVVFRDELWIVLGTGDQGAINDVWSSPDGYSWTLRATMLPAVWNQSTLVFDDQLWSLYGDNGRTVDSVSSSSDGMAWHTDGSPTRVGNRAGQCGLVYRDAMWVIGGYASGMYNDVWCSTDGATWSADQRAAPFTARQEAGCLVHDGRVWLIGGLDATFEVRNDVWSAR